MTAFDSTPSTVGRLSAAQKEYLVDHIDGSRPVRCTKLDIATRGALIAKQLIRYKPHLNVTARPEFTVLTDRGRDVLCAVLADYADKLTRFVRVAKLFDHASSVERETLSRNLLALDLHRHSYRQPMEKIGYGFHSRTGDPPNGGRDLRKPNRS